jgi:quercetin dioxygenase-like cupin family protein
MKRKNFILSLAVLYPLAGLAKLKNFIHRAGKGFKVNANDARFGDHFHMKAVTTNLLDLKISGKDTDGDLAIFEQTGLSPNGGPPLHIHPHQDEMFYAMEGSYRFQVGDDKFDMKAGDTIFLPRNVPHAFVQLTERGKMMVIFQPAGKMEEFFRQTSTWTTAPTQPEIVKLFESCDMKVVGPPLKAD